MSESELSNPHNDLVAETYRKLLGPDNTLTIPQAAALLLWYEADDKLLALAQDSDPELERIDQRLRIDLRGWITNPERAARDQRLSLDVIAQWSRENGIGQSTLIEHYFGPFEPVQTPNVPWTVLQRYRTPEIDALLAVVEHFWINFNSADPGSAPTQLEVVDFIQKLDPSMSDNQAMQIDRITRHPKARAGGNRKRKP